jgi:hypothetical protein
MGNSSRIDSGEGMVHFPPGFDVKHMAETQETADKAQTGNDVAVAYLNSLRELLEDYQPLVNHLHTFKGRITYKATHKMGLISLVRFLLNKIQWFNTEKTAQETMREGITKRHDRLIPLQVRLQEVISQLDPEIVQDINRVSARVASIEANPLAVTYEQIRSISDTIYNVREKISPEDHLDIDREMEEIERNINRVE